MGRAEELSEEEFQSLLETKVEIVEKVIRRYLPAQEGYAGKVIEAMNYSVLAGGKRLRPMMMAETGGMYGARTELLEPFMAALEMIHTYSLIHDDLPAMDNDQYRRGRKTTWAVYGEGMAVLAGDGLLNYAYETALRAYDAAADGAEKDCVFAAMNVLAKNAGIYGMVGGQCADIQTDIGSGTGKKAASGADSDPEGNDPAGQVREPVAVDEEMLEYIQRKKTACLIESALTIGAILGAAPEEDIRALDSIGVDIGLAFQIEDDILDVTGNQEEMGKTLGKDAEEGKATYVSMHGLDGAKAKVHELTNHALQQMDSLSMDDAFLRALIRHLMTRTK